MDKAKMLYDASPECKKLLIVMVDNLQSIYGRPINVKVIVDENRSLTQNALQHVWYNDIELSGYSRSRDARRYSKLHFGVPIIRSEDETFRNFYDAALKNNLTYEQKLEMMDFFPVTSLMNKLQMTRYLDAVQQHYSEQGVILEAQGEYKEANSKN